ncbi:CARDB domain-containing protein [Robertmurraya sp. FSL R5-0851]|uniref:CARDB domain-containing protein n=1 Tax=Robertmurraya sp. FSL R5-0851 TaxID=2921584 RepID=UPI0030F99C27
MKARKLKNVILSTLASLLLCSTIFDYIAPPSVEAAESRKVSVPSGTINKYMRWEDPKIVSYPNSDYGNYPSTYQYNDGGFTGTLTAKRIILRPKQKDYHQDAIYRTEYRTFTKTYSNIYGRKHDEDVVYWLGINEDGYSGNIPRVSLSWTDNWARGRTASLTQYWTDSNYREFASEAPVPTTYNGTHYDGATGQNVSYSLPKSGGLYSIENTKMWIRYRSLGRSDWYDKAANYYLGFMSNNATSYYAGNWTDPMPGEAPDRYYGLPRSLSPSDVRLVAYGWDEPGVVHADFYASLGPLQASRLEYSNGSYYWKSESGKLNKYRRGVWIDYDLNVPVSKYRQAYSGTFALPDYIVDYTGTATYEGTLSKEVFDHWDEYYTSDQWDVEVEYEGTVYSTNLTAKTITITDTNNSPVTHLVKGRQYKASMVAGNNGELNVGAYKVGFYEQGNRKTQLDIPSHNSGSDQTLTYTFTAETSGNRTFMFKVDDNNVIAETNETDADNTKQGTILVNTLPTVDLTYTPTDVYEGDTVQVCSRPQDEDNNPLTVKIFIKKDNGTESTVLSRTNVASGVEQCYSFVTEVGRYDIRTTVNDGYDEIGTSTWFYSKPLIINGYVNHTELWKQQHLKEGNQPNQFYSGEKFLLDAETSPYPTNYVKATLKASRADQSLVNTSVPLNYQTNILYKGELYDVTFLEYPKNLKVGPAAFEFEVQYSNGVVKKTTVYIEIISDSFKTFRIHRRF